MRIAAVLILAGTLVLLPEPGAFVEPGNIPCSIDELKAGIHNWLEHYEDSEWCWHVGPELFQQRCRLYWSHGLD